MKERIKKLRKEKHLTQQEFADKIGISRNNVATYEIGRNNPSEAVISLICREFHVNETWLRSGEGEMFTQQDDSLLGLLAQRYSLDERAMAMVESFLELSEEHREVIARAVENAAAKLHAHSASIPEAPPAESKPYTAEELAAYEKVRAAKEKERGMSSGSTIGESA